MIRQLGKYRIDSVLGKGAMGVVYKAFDPLIERTVALKTIRKELFSDDQQAELIGRFKNEAQAAGRLNHPHIVTVYEYGEDSESAYIAMEYVDGAPLGSLMAQGRPAALARVLAWMSGMLGALDYAHARGVVHRDIKPANLLVAGDGALKVTDFGIARIESSTLTQAGSMIGTPSYMAPEQLRGETADGRSDVFSAGIVLYQLLTGERPFSGTPPVVMQQILAADPPPPSQLVPALGTAWDAVLARALAKSPAGRYPSARSFLDAVQAAGRGEPPASARAGTADDDRTVLAPDLRAPAAEREASEPAAASGSATGSGSGTGTGTSIGGTSFGGTSMASSTVTPWKIEALPELEPLLAHQIGPMARLLLRKLAAEAQGMDQLCDLILPHIPTDAGRAQFQQAAGSVKRKLSANGTGTGMERPRTLAGATAPAAARTAAVAPEPFDEAWAERVAQRLALAIGPIAPVLARRAARQAGDKATFLQLLAGHIESQAERIRFLAEAASL